MILCIGEVLTAEELAILRNRLSRMAFGDGRATAGWYARDVKENLQATAGPESEAARRLVLAALSRSTLFQMACRPHRVGVPLLNLYEAGMQYGLHMDDAVMPGEPALRTDISVTLFLSEPEDYDGGELIIESTAGEQRFKLAAGSLLLYPSSTLHRVAMVERGARYAAVTWVQSQVRDPARRELLFDLDTARRRLLEQEGKSPTFDLLSKSLGNLLRMWADI